MYNPTFKLSTAALLWVLGITISPSAATTAECETDFDGKFVVGYEVKGSKLTPPDDLQCTGGGDTFVVPGSLSGSVLQFHYPEGRPTTTMIVDTIGQLVEDGLDGNSVEPPDIYADEGFSICHDPDADTDTETDLYLAFEGEQQFWGGQVEDLTPEDANGHLILATKKFADYSKYKIRIFPCDSNDDDDASFEDDF